MSESGILSVLRGVLKPLLSLCLAIALLICASWTWFALNSPPGEGFGARLVLDPQESLPPDAVLFQQTQPAAYTQSGFAPFVIYEVALRDPAKDRFSRAFTLNFHGEPDVALCVARYENDRWIRLEGATVGSTTGIALSIKLDKPGIFAMGRFLR